MIADYWESAVEPELPELEERPTVSDLEIVYSGKPAVRAGGGFKKFTLKTRVDGKLEDASDDAIWDAVFVVYDKDNNPINCRDKIVLEPQKGHECKIKCTNDYSLIGKTFTVTATTEYGSKSLIVEVTSL
jgi:hypothetical protein